MELSFIMARVRPFQKQHINPFLMDGGRHRLGQGDAGLALHPVHLSEDVHGCYGVYGGSGHGVSPARELKVEI
jgi:hypothetical protein